ncbi:MAG: hypothetical protein JWL90_3715 [Chthoniobacteraceae bacterium]|nr:hypothetical protein [Chthoniobacteraceae bacterium]
MRKLIGMMVALMGASACAETAVEINLSAQRAYLIENGAVVASSPIASGRPSRPTPNGRFRVIEKDLNHRSSIYGRIVDRNGRTLVGNATSRTRVPRGARFVAAPMRYFLRFHGPSGMHAGYLPGYPASHGCVRLPEEYAALLYQRVQIGSPVRVVGRAS